MSEQGKEDPGVSPQEKKFFIGTVGVLGIAGLLLHLAGADSAPPKKHRAPARVEQTSKDKERAERKAWDEGINKEIEKATKPNRPLGRTWDI